MEPRELDDDFDRRSPPTLNPGIDAPSAGYDAKG
jgi:hypothetical protein